MLVSKRTSKARSQAFNYRGFRIGFKTIEPCKLPHKVVQCFHIEKKNLKPGCTESNSSLDDE
jgi:hypothetical protein